MIDGGLFFTAIDGVEAVVLTPPPPLNADAADSSNAGKYAHEWGSQLCSSVDLYTELPYSE